MRSFTDQRLIVYSHSTTSIGFLLPLPAVIVALAGEDYKYTIGGFPPSVCITRNSDLLFYSTNLVSDILLAAATCFLIIIFWKVHKVSYHDNYQAGMPFFLVIAPRCLWEKERRAINQHSREEVAFCPLLLQLIWCDSSDQFRSLYCT